MEACLVMVVGMGSLVCNFLTIQFCLFWNTKGKNYMLFISWLSLNNLDMFCIAFASALLYEFAYELVIFIFVAFQVEFLLSILFQIMKLVYDLAYVTHFIEFSTI